MKTYINFLIFVLIFNLSCNSQNNMKQENEFEKLYPFDGYYIDLERLIRLETDGIPARNFKTESVYSFRFYAPRNWVDNYYQSVVYKGYKFSIQNDNSVLIEDNVTKKKISIANNEKNIEIDNTSGSVFLVSTNTGVIHLKRLVADNGYIIYKYDETGKIIFKTNIQHTFIKKEGNTYYHNPYLTYFTCTNNFMVFNSYDSKIPKTVLLDLTTGKTAEFQTTYNGVIRTDNEENIPGFIEIKQNGFKTVILNLTWDAKISNFGDNTAETLVKDDVLYICFYHFIATGAQLFAYNLTTGEYLWKADVVQLNVGHSEYYNTVYLSAYKDKIIMEGIEAYGKYVQIFDCKTGKRLFSTID